MSVAGSRQKSAASGPGVPEGPAQRAVRANAPPASVVRDRRQRTEQRTVYMLLLLAIAWVVWQACAVLPPFVLAAVFAYVLSPAISAVHARLHIPRLVAAAGVYLCLVLVAGAVMVVLEPHLVRQTRALINDFPGVLRDLFIRATGSQQIEFLGATIEPDSLARAAGGALATAFNTPTDLLHMAERVLHNALELVVFLVALLYFLVDGPRLGAYALRFVLVERRPEVVVVAQHIHERLSRYLQGQLFLVGLMALASWLVLHSVFHLHFALPLAIATGFLEVVPFLGPILATALAVSIALWQWGPPTALGVLVAYMVLRQLEDQLIMPVVIGRAVDLHPLVIIFAVLAGERVAGVLGMLLAVPVAATVKVLLDVWGPWEEGE